MPSTLAGYQGDPDLSLRVRVMPMLSQAGGHSPTSVFTTSQTDPRLRRDKNGDRSDGKNENVEVPSQGFACC